MTRATCETCRWFVKHEAGHVYGDCHRYPATFNFHANISDPSAWRSDRFQISVTDDGSPIIIHNSMDRRENAVPDIIAMARENERLREALRRVIDAPMIDHRNPENGYRQIASAALESRDD